MTQENQTEIKVPNEVLQVVKEIEAAGARIKEQITEKAKQIGEIQQKVEATKNEFQKIQKNVQDTAKELQTGNWQDILEKLLPSDAQPAIAKVQKYADDLKGAINQKAQAYVKQVQDYIANVKKTIQEGDLQKALEKKFQGVFQNSSDFKDATKAAKNFAGSITQALKEGGIKEALKTALPSGLLDKMFSVENIGVKARSMVEQVKQTFAQGGLNTVLDLFNTRNWQDGLNKVKSDLKGWVQDIPGIFGEAGNAIQEKLAGLIGPLKNSLSGIWSSLSNSFSNSGGWFENIFAGIVSAFAGRAAGGDANAETPYIVGERGPELFVPGASGTIIPNHKLNGGTTASAGAPQVTVNVINNTGQQVNAKQESRFDGQKYIVDVWLDALTRNVGGMRDVVNAGR
jgi:uncharacterized membrane protein YeaQ/YmgE (transglycosylase-associated protein family)